MPITLVTKVGAALRSSVAFYGGDVSITFDGDYTTGTYWNGDWWVLRPASGSVGIASTAPEAAGDGSNPASTGSDRVRHGATWNWNTGAEASLNDVGFGAAEQGWDSHDPVVSSIPYVNSRNIDPGNTGSTFYATTEGAFMKTSSNTDAFIAEGSSARGRVIKDVAILTVVDEEPPAYAFRPGAHTTDKSHRWTIFDLDLTHVPSGLPAPASAPSYDAVIDKVERHHVMGYLDYNANRVFMPSNHMEYYGADNAQNIANAVLLAMTDAVTTQERLKLLRSIVQIGIDVFDRYQEGGRWICNGGLYQGYKLPLVVAATLLDDANMKAVAQVNPDDAEDVNDAFGDDRQTWEVSAADIGRETIGTNNNDRGAWATATNYGLNDRVLQDGISYECVSAHTSGTFATDLANANWVRISYDANDVGMPEWGEQHTRQNTRDARYVYGPYRGVNTRWQIGATIAANLIDGARANWNWEPLFNYADRLTFRSFFPEGGLNPYVDESVATNQPDAFQVDMMKTFRDSASDASGVAIWDWPT